MHSIRNNLSAGTPAGQQNANPNTRREIAVILPYAVSIRDFVGSGLMARLAADPELAITAYTLNPELPELAEAQNAGVTIRALRPHKDKRVERILKNFYLYVFSDHFVYVQQGFQGRPMRKALAAALVRFRKALGTGRFIRAYERLMLTLFGRSGTKAQLEGTPDLVIGTRSLLNSIDYGIIAEARVRHIPILTLAGSWDNFTTKGFFPFKAKKVVVWNRKMERELLKIYAVPSEQIEIAGYPRQGILRRLSRGMDVKEYLASIGHDRFDRFILYSASYSELTRVPGEEYPLEYQVMVKVGEALENALPDDVCIILRLHPFSDPNGIQIFDGLKRSYVFVPGRKDQYVERVMGPEDEAHLARQIALSECVVSMASTITIDALSLGKPVINTRFDPCAAVPFTSSNRRFFDYNHFADMTRLVDLPMAENTQDVIEFVEGRVMGERSTGADMNSFEHWYVPDDSASYPLRVHHILREVLGVGHAAQ